MLNAKEVMEKIISLISASASATKDAATSVVNTLIGIKTAILNILNSAVVENQSTIITKIDSSNEKLDSIIAKDNQGSIVQKIDVSNEQLALIVAKDNQSDIVAKLGDVSTSEKQSLIVAKIDSSNEKLDSIIAKDNQSEVVVKINDIITALEKQDTILATLTEIVTNQTTILNALANQSTAAKQEEILTKLSILDNLSTSAKQDEIIGLLTTISTK